MVLSAELVRSIAIKHELNIVVSIGNLHVDPAQLLRIRPSAPRLFKAQYLAVKVHGLLTVPNEEAQVIDLRGDTRCRLELAGDLCFKAIRKSLHELDQHAIRVLDLKGVVT